MKCVILAGGLGTRLSEETVVKPKPMVEIGGYPILWHIMKHYSFFGINDFIICCGYKGYIIKEYFANYALHMSDITLDMQHGKMEIHDNHAEPWKVTCVDTGEQTMTGGRIKRIQKYIGDETFCMTYGDGVSNIDIVEEIKFHQENNNHATLAAVQPPGRWGHFDMAGSKITSFEEKTQGDGGWVSGGFFVLDPEVFELIENDSTIFERAPLETLARTNRLSAWKHRGFWHPMDTLRDKMYLEDLWQRNAAPWKLW